MNYWFERLQNIQDDVQHNSRKRTFDLIQEMMDDMASEYGIKDLDGEPIEKIDYHKSNKDLLDELCDLDSIAQVVVMQCLTNGVNAMAKIKDKELEAYDKIEAMTPEERKEAGVGMPIINAHYWFSMLDKISEHINQFYK